MNSAKLLIPCHNNDNRKFLESFIIKNTNNFNRHPGEIKIDDILNDLMKNERFYRNILGRTLGHTMKNTIFKSTKIF